MLADTEVSKVVQKVFPEFIQKQKVKQKSILEGGG